MLTKTRLSTVVFALFCQFALVTAHADTVILKDGTELEGKIEEETPEYVKIVVQVTASIRDPKFVKREDIREIVKQTPDEIAFEKLGDILPLGDMLPASDYATILETRIKPFLDRFPASPKKKAVEEMQQTIENEMAKVSEGHVKLGGEWISPDTIAADPFNHKADILAYQMEQKLAAGDLMGALSAFEQLQTEFDESKGFARSIPLAVKALDSLDAQLEQMKIESEFKIKKREQDLALMPANERVNTQNAFDRQMEIFQENREAAKEAGHKWLPISVWEPKSLEDATKTASDQRKAITTLDPTVETQRAVLLAQVIGAMHKQDWAMAAAQATLAKEAGADSETLKKLAEEAKTNAENAGDAAKTAAEQAEKDRLEAIRMEREKEIAERGKPGSETADPTTATETPATESAGTDTAPPATPATRESTADAETDATASDADATKKGGMPLPFIIGIVGIMIAVTIFMLQNNKARARDDAESFQGDGTDLP